MSLQDKINRARQGVKSGVQAVSSPDLFPTPADVADRVVDALELFPDCRVLEPSAGTGALMGAIERAEPTARITAVERNASLAARLGSGIYVTDFLDLDPDSCSPGKFDRVAMNPPFSKGADMRHVAHAVEFLKPGGILVAIVAAGPRQTLRFSDWEDVERLPSGTFQGTGVSARIIKFQKRGA